MSVRVMGMVWYANIPQNEKFTLLAYADHAWDDGSHVYPGTKLIVHKTGYTRRQAQRITSTLKEAREPKGKYPERKPLLIPDGWSNLGTKKYRIDLKELEELYTEPPNIGGRNNDAPIDRKGDNSDKGGRNLEQEGATPTPPEPLINRPLTKDEKILEIIKEQIKPEMQLNEYNRRVKPLFFVGKQNGSIEYGQNDTFTTDWLNQRMITTIQPKARAAYDEPELTLTFVTAPLPEGVTQ